jgi:ribosomal protein S18 acetylase RimI-like enzyme
MLVPKLLRAQHRRTIFRSLTYYPEVPAHDSKAEGVTWAVSPSAQGAGVGQALMAAVVEECQRLGVESLKAGHVNPDQPATAAAYRRAGFVRAERREFYPGVFVDVYTRTLVPARAASGGVAAADIGVAPGSSPCSQPT